MYEWPYDKFELFRKAAHRKEMNARIDFVFDVAQAVGGVIGGGKGLNKYTAGMKEIVDEL